MAQDDVSRQDQTSSILTACLVHLHAEELAIEQLEFVLHRNRQALADRDTPMLVEIGTQLQAHRDASVEIGKRRFLLQQSLGFWLGIAPEQVTLSRVADRLDGDGKQQLVTLQWRIRERVQGLSRLLRDNAMIAAQQNLIICQTLVALTGQTELHRYTASGQMQERPASSLFEAEL